ncbi:prepilin-type N-terminal cleavage/methylation domain-containing protein [Idiomarina sp. PL1-037]|uniref:prepilin-type N-terminal cleavage/methylation domain-containing protein n=1 Tax=Idiomarina sp. PL1-037 TaxID=3095365 RepID=UPI002ACC0958|nr:prepilin-type N-terminal cleavage/methylation domain-containing protein [Idiomarina sp. PL1-037]WQC53348.1 prepilin-type N-terminal cleavage/methylation domain-containing protein [Idiomarina sp. PL1-037]
MSVKQSKGFTLIEIIIGIVVIAIVVAVVTAGMGPLFRQTVDPWQQVRAAELGQSLMNEIMARKFDENNSALVRCGEGGGPCTTPATSCAGPGNPLPNTNGSETREDFDDVDDFNCLGINNSDLENIFGNAIDTNYYSGFGAEVRISEPEDDQVKRIDIVIITPQDQRIEFSGRRGNW